MREQADPSLPLTEKGKSVFKKWFTFEKEHGDDAGVEEVKQRAVGFVQGRSQPEGGDEDDEE